MPALRILRATVCNGRGVEAGEVIDASAEDARVLVAMGKAALSVASDPPPIPKDPADGPAPVPLVAPDAVVPTVDNRAAKRRNR